MTIPMVVHVLLGYIHADTPIFRIMKFDGESITINTQYHANLVLIGGVRVSTPNFITTFNWRGLRLLHE